MGAQSGGATDFLANINVGIVVLVALALTSLRMMLLSTKRPVAKWAAEMIESAVLAGIFVFLLIRPFCAQAFYIPSESMEPGLGGHDAGQSSTGVSWPDTIHDHLFVNKMVYRLRDPQRGEIVVFRAPKAADYEGHFQNENILIKRVVGVPGDTIWVHDGQLWRNGQLVNEAVCNAGVTNEPCIREPMSSIISPDAHFAVDAPLKLGPNEYFMMGDNRNYSADSRFWGPLTRDRIMGQAAVKFWPLNRIGLIR